MQMIGTRMLGTAAPPGAGLARAQRRRRHRDTRAQGAVRLGTAEPTGDGPASSKRRRRHRRPPPLLSPRARGRFPS
eukprot:451369-Heterocapsa_arctica.AAC.1